MDDEARQWLTLGIFAAAILWGGYGRGSLAAAIRELMGGDRMLKRRDHVGSFIARDDQGNEHTLHVLVNIVDAGNKSDPHAERRGLKSIVTEDGDPVNRIDQGKYQVVTTGEILHSTDPDFL